MKRVSKAILIIAALLVMLGVAAIFGVNRYVQSPAARDRIQAALTEALGVPVEITRASFGWSGLQLAGLRIPSGERNFLEASGFTAEYRVLPLLHRRLVLRKLTLANPRVLWAQNGEGKWVLPLLPAKGHTDKLANTGPKKPAEPRGSGFTVVLDRIVLVNGTLELLDGHGQQVATASEVAMDYTVRSPEEVEGTLSARRVAWGNFMTFSEVRTPLKYARGELALSDLQGEVAGGKVRGGLTVRTDDARAAFAMKLNLDRVDLGRISTEAGWQPGQASGTLGGTVEWHGSFRDLDHTEAKGQVTIADGHFEQLDLFQTLGQILQIPQLADMRAKTGAIDFTYANEKTTIDRLLLETGDLSFATQGTVKTDGKMNLTARLAVSERIAKQLPTFVRSNFGTPDAQGRYGIDFDITGRTDKPKTNLLNRIIGGQVGGQLNDLLGSVFGGSGEKKKDDDKKKKKEKRKAADEPAASEPAPAPVPAAEPGNP